MKLGLGLGIAFIGANQHLTAGGGGAEALYGLSDDGDELGPWSSEGDLGPDENNDLEWTDTPTHKIDPETGLWVLTE